MYFFEAVILGVVQGLTEFLPISSSAHLTLIPQILEWKAPLLHSLTFDVALHFGTLLAVIVFFWKDLGKISSHFITGIITKTPFEHEQSKLGWLIILGTIPIVIIALCFKDFVETLFRHPVMVATMLIVFGLIMGAAEKIVKRERQITTMKWKEALIIGVAQSLALMPGVSRSGATISAGLMLGFNRAQAARFAFLLSIPSIIGATLFALKDLCHISEGLSWMTMIIGTLTAAIAGYACIAFLLAFLKKRSLWIFVAYRVVMGTAILGWYLLKIK